MYHPINFDARAFVGHELLRQYFDIRYGEILPGYPGESNLETVSFQVEDELMERIHTLVDPVGLSVSDFALLTLELAAREFRGAEVPVEGELNTIEIAPLLDDLQMLGKLRRGIVKQLYRASAELLEEYNAGTITNIYVRGDSDEQQGHMGRAFVARGCGAPGEDA